ncbi:hypothetical protein J4225_04515 [Candidatus Pacearchaeota archaeon]|nr:hypothetical protein [Candidatus Pacearchaeota archaeon]
MPKKKKSRMKEDKEKQKAEQKIMLKNKNKSPKIKLKIDEANLERALSEAEDMVENIQFQQFLPAVSSSATASVLRRIQVQNQTTQNLEQGTANAQVKRDEKQEQIIKYNNRANAGYETLTVAEKEMEKYTATYVEPPTLVRNERATQEAHVRRDLMNPFKGRGIVQGSMEPERLHGEIEQENKKLPFENPKEKYKRVVRI